MGIAVATLDERQALWARLQSLEDDLVAAGKRNVTIQGAKGVFSWVLRGAGAEPAEALSFFEQVKEVEDMIIAAKIERLVEMTQHGIFTWLLRN